MKNFFISVLFIVFSLLLFSLGFLFRGKYSSYIKKDKVENILALAQEYNSEKLDYIIEKIEKKPEQVKCDDCLDKKILGEVKHLHSHLEELEYQVNQIEDYGNSQNYKTKTIVRNHYYDNKRSCNKKLYTSLWRKYCSNKRKGKYTVKEFKIPLTSGMCLMSLKDYVRSECAKY